MKCKKAAELKVSNLLKEKYVNLELNSDTKEEIIKELVGIVCKSSKVKNKKVFYKCLIEREMLGSTGIGSGVAIPHAKTNAAKDFVLAFARKNTGVDFGALDGERTYLFFVLASPKQEVGKHLKILSEISHLVKDKFTVGLLRHARDKKEILKIISDTEKRSK